ncbi:unnamed protein product [Lepeophtheirus salmonis]|uniref:(salmon louse) hypothetical protein n=1 Tax=Lepeophtheirus salmonis TaxID=72036 RepID=A0A7R8CNV0_LEPSM|nr:unnamed protein product [Lepeophtheirus salmonis]CAF2848517.1 unnamed protein product [Lepeophtheirus salmonis]
MFRISVVEDLVEDVRVDCLVRLEEDSQAGKSEDGIVKCVSELNRAHVWDNLDDIIAEGMHFDLMVSIRAMGRERGVYEKKICRHFEYLGLKLYVWKPPLFLPRALKNVWIVPTISFIS